MSPFLPSANYDHEQLPLVSALDALDTVGSSSITWLGERA